MHVFVLESEDWILGKMGPDSVLLGVFTTFELAAKYAELDEDTPNKRRENREISYLIYQEKVVDTLGDSRELTVPTMIRRWFPEPDQLSAKFEEPKHRSQALEEK